jgi:hypothetical protein
LENTSKWFNCQGKYFWKIFWGNLTSLADLWLKCCIEGQKLKNEITGRNIVTLPPWLPKK